MLSAASLVGSFLTSLVHFVSLRGRGAEFLTHILLGLMLLVQICAFVLSVVIAAFITARRGQFGLSWFTSAFFSIAVAGLVGQYFAVRHLHVDSSTIP
jgi:hypothetical protein